MDGIIGRATKLSARANTQAKRGNAQPDMATCPIATVDVEVNGENRNLAIENHGYGPMNPNEANTEFWKGIAELWNLTPAQAKASRCGNCAAFIQTQEMMACIAGHLGLDDDYPAKGWESMRDNREKTVMASGLGYCQTFAFKCAADRTCRAWLHGGPITK